MKRRNGTGRRRTSLRVRLLAVLVAFLAFVCLAVGAITTFALRTFLVDRLDAQLTSANGRSANAGGPQSPDQGEGHEPNEHVGAQFLLAPGQAAGTLGARLSDNSVEAAVLDEGGALEHVPSSDLKPLSKVPVDGHPHTVDLEDLGSFRVLATKTSDGDVLVTGLPLHDLDRTMIRLVIIELLVAGSAVVAAAVLGAVVVRRTLRPLSVVAETATRVSALPLAHGDVEITERIGDHETHDGTEVGDVARAVNRLLDEVDHALTARHASEMKVRRFVADASHELRTPLTAIRGYAELTRRMRDDAPAELAYAMDRVESEAERMTTMVEDLLLLARLDAGRELERKPVDVVHLLLDVVSDATASGPEHHWQVDLPDEPINVIGDANSLHQVFANLLANARVHTPPGTRVTVSTSTERSGWVEVRVADNGPGISPDVLPTVFERFARGAESRSRESGSTGLGLAIVRAIVEAHDGAVEVVSSPGETVFTVRLPR